MKNLWLTDPKDGKLSVSLTLLLAFGVSALVCDILKATGTVNDVSSLNELFYSSIALYFGRRNINIGGKAYSAGDAADVASKIAG